MYNKNGKIAQQIRISAILQKLIY